MSSTNKTEVLRLNQWISSDKPKREDFNYDNQVIENNFNYHTSDKFIHITQGERENWNAPLKCPLQWYLPITDRWL